MTYSWIPRENELGLQPIEVTQTTQAHKLGKIIRASHATYGHGEFIYLKGVANTVAGLMVSYDTLNGTTTLLPSTANLNQPIAVAMTANVLANYGWYQISGAAVIKKTAVAITPSVPVYISGTTGRVRGTAASGKQIVNARSVNAATIAAGTSTVTVLIQRPFAQGAVA